MKTPRMLLALLIMCLAALGGCIKSNFTRNSPDQEMQFDHHGTAASRIAGISWIAYVSNTTFDAGHETMERFDLLSYRRRGDDTVRIEVQSTRDTEQASGIAAERIALLDETVLDYFAAARDVQDLPPLRATVRLAYSPGVRRTNTLRFDGSPLRVKFSFSARPFLNASTEDAVLFATRIAETLLHEGLHALRAGMTESEFESELRSYSLARCADAARTGLLDQWTFDFMRTNGWEHRLSQVTNAASLASHVENAHPSFAAGFLVDANLRLIQSRALENGETPWVLLRPACLRLLREAPDLRREALFEPLAPTTKTPKMSGGRAWS